MAAFLAAVVWGSIVSAQPVPLRINVHASVVEPGWYAALPINPAAATEAYLQRVSL